jgi:hypothetical protein
MASAEQVSSMTHLPYEQHHAHGDFARVIGNEFRVVGDSAAAIRDGTVSLAKTLMRLEDLRMDRPVEGIEPGQPVALLVSAFDQMQSGRAVEGLGSGRESCVCQRASV